MTALPTRYTKDFSKVCLSAPPHDVCASQVGRKMHLLGIVVAAVLFVSSARSAGADTGQLNVENAQAILAVQALDGWLVWGHGNANEVATGVVSVEGESTWQWFFWIPAEGDATVLFHIGDSKNFSKVTLKKQTYAGNGELRSRLKALLGNAKTVAMEYAPGSGIARLTSVPATTIKLLKKMDVDVVSSENLVQFTKAQWGERGRIAHYVAAHHIEVLSVQGFEFVGQELRAGRKITEYDVVQFLKKGMEIRGLVGPPPRVAANPNSRKPNYFPSRASAKAIVPGLLLEIELAAKIGYDDAAIFAEGAWVGFVGDEVPAEFERAFAAVRTARNAVLNFLQQKISSGSMVKGYAADEKAKESLTQSGYDSTWLHATGHSLDGERMGYGANLDSGRARDERNLVKGTGFVVGPGIYLPNFGIRSAVSAFVGSDGLEITMSLQEQIFAIAVTKQ